MAGASGFNSNMLSGIGRLADGPSGRIYSRSSLKEMTNQIKDDLGQMVQRNEIVLIKMFNGVDLFASLFACWELEVIPVVLAPAASRLEKENIVRSFGIKAVMDNEGVHSCDKISRSLYEFPQDILSTTALILLTSGTLGSPKAVMLSFSALIEKFNALSRVIGFREMERTLCLLPLCFGHGLICNSLFPLLSGADLFIYPAFDIQKIQRYLDGITKHEINFFSTVPVVLKVLSQQQIGSHSVRRVHCASAPLEDHDWQAARQWLGEGADVHHVYGMTEFGGWVAGTRTHSPSQPGLVGSPWGVELKMIDVSGSETDGAKEISLRGPSFMSGFVDNGQFQRVDRSMWFETGDLGRLDSSGNLVLMGRSKLVINFGGYKIYPEDIERLLAEHPDISDVCCLPVESDNVGEVPAAACVVRRPISERELKAWCSERIDPHKVPVRWYFLKEMPRSDRGKLLRGKVKELCEKEK